ncbi:hypothetical protein [Corynebacterium pseudopelargi]|uniref:hypothetical protein n=1 Tax=Corynebacterium pseudopelargi TaxID=2080757 RepID=UPI000F4D43C6|nr:hypothetical protein [Corynebacterium pseudopelargi]
MIEQLTGRTQEALQLDHVTPLSDPETPGTTLGNLVPTSRGFNEFKNSRHFVVAVAEWHKQNRSNNQPPEALLNYSHSTWSDTPYRGEPVEAVLSGLTSGNEGEDYPD